MRLVRNLQNPAAAADPRLARYLQNPTHDSHRYPGGRERSATLAQGGAWSTKETCNVEPSFRGRPHRRGSAQVPGPADSRRCRRPHRRSWPPDGELHQPAALALRASQTPAAQSSRWSSRRGRMASARTGGASATAMACASRWAYPTSTRSSAWSLRLPQACGQGEEEPQAGGRGGVARALGYALLARELRPLSRQILR
jgi:hypothetical protein